MIKKPDSFKELSDLEKILTGKDKSKFSKVYVGNECRSYEVFPFSDVDLMLLCGEKIKGVQDILTKIEKRKPPNQTKRNEFESKIQAAKAAFKNEAFLCDQMAAIEALDLEKLADLFVPDAATQPGANSLLPLHKLLLYHFLLS